MHIFSEISILLALSATVALIMRLLRQPLIIGHILTGIIVGPSVLGLVQSAETIEVFASFGIALLLFIVGLGLNPKEVKDVGRVSLITGIGQVLFTSTIGFFLVKSLGYSTIMSVYIAIALTFSSTIIILKLLSDKKEHNKLYGRIAIGFLLVQDIIATFALMIAAATGQGGLSVGSLAVLAAKGIGLIVLVFLVANIFISRMTSFLARSQELLFLFAIAWGFGVGALSLESGFSLEVGALFAGIALASMPYAQEVASRLRPLRDFFIVVFFLALGAKLDVAGVGEIVWQALGLSLFVLIGNPLIVMVLMGILGYTKRTSFKAGLTVAQISEFSLIFMLLGLRHGQVSEQAVSLVTIIGIITIAMSSYMIIYSETLFLWMERYLRLFERRKTRGEQEIHHNYEGILFGYLRGGSEFVKVFKNMGKKFVVVDYDPDAVDQMERHQVPYLYGDATDIELLEEAGMDRAKIIISTITNHETNVALIKILESRNPNAVTIFHADNVPEAEQLYSLGVSYVMLPHYIGTEKISSFIKKSGFKKADFKRFREKHQIYLQSHYMPPSEEE